MPARIAGTFGQPATSPSNTSSCPPERVPIPWSFSASASVFPSAASSIARHRLVPQSTAISAPDARLLILGHARPGSAVHVTIAAQLEDAGPDELGHRLIGGHAGSRTGVRPLQRGQGGV